MKSFSSNKAFALLGAFVCAPFLFGANGGGCGPETVNPGGPCIGVDGGPCSPPAGSSEGGAVAADASPDGAGACVSSQGGACGGNTSHPCTCTTGLVCTPGDSGLPFGDVGGTCEPAPACTPLPCPSGAPWDPSTCSCTAPDAASACISSEGGPCGGNTSRPCTCATGLVCSPGDSGLPFGDVGGTCEAPGVCDPLPCPSGSAWDPSSCSCATLDAGLGCISSEGGRCGGNTSHPCTCTTGLVCTPGDSGLPFGDVGGTCEPRAAMCDPGPCAAGSVWDTVTCACAQPCQAASDCTGALPALCALCVTDGGAGPISGCAHFECNGGRCETRICD